MTKLATYLIFMFSYLFSINNNVNDIANYLDNKSLSISGEFYKYDFPQVLSHWDYVFKSANGTILQLRGNPPTQSDLFGWKSVDIVLSQVPDYYFIYLGDFDFDGDSRFDWILIQNSQQLAYKLIGNTIQSTFIWSEKIPVTFYISNNQVVFTKNSNIAPSSPSVTTGTPAPIVTNPSNPVSQQTPAVPSPNTTLERPPTPPI